MAPSRPFPSLRWVAAVLIRFRAVLEPVPTGTVATAEQGPVWTTSETLSLPFPSFAVCCSLPILILAGILPFAVCPTRTSMLAWASPRVLRRRSKSSIPLTSSTPSTMSTSWIRRSIWRIPHSLGLSTHSIFLLIGFRVAGGFSLVCASISNPHPKIKKRPGEKGHRDAFRSGSWGNS